MTGKFTTRPVQQTLECDALIGQPALQGSRAEVQLSGEILYPRTLTGEQLLQNALGLFAKCFLCELLTQLRFKLRSHRRQQIRVVSDKRKIHL